MPPHLRDTSPMTTTAMYLPNQFNLGETAATSAIITTPPEALPQHERFKVDNVTQPFAMIKMKKIIKINHHHHNHHKYYNSSKNE